MKRIWIVSVLLFVSFFLISEESISPGNDEISEEKSRPEETEAETKEKVKIPWEHLKPSLTGIGWGNILDSSVSPLMKEGPSIGNFGSDYYKKNNWIIDLGGYSSIGLLYQNYNDGISDSIPFICNVSLDYNPLFLYRFASASPGNTEWDFYLGAGPSLFWTSDFHLMTNISNFMNFDLSLKLAFKSELDFTLGKKKPKDFTFHFGVNSTVVSWYNNYPYAPQAVFRGYDIITGYFGDMKWGSVNKVWRAVGKAGLTYHYKNGNALDVSYIYKLYNYWKQDYAVQGGSGMIAFGYLMRLDNTKVVKEAE